MTAKEYQESRKRAGELQQLCNTNPEEAKRQMVKSWEQFAKKVREYKQEARRII